MKVCHVLVSLFMILFFPRLSGQERKDSLPQWSLSVWAGSSVSWYRDIGTYDRNFLSLDAGWGSSLIGGYEFGETGVRLDGLLGFARRRNSGVSQTYYLSLALTPMYNFRKGGFSLGLGPQVSLRKHWDTRAMEFREGTPAELDYLFRLQKRWHLGEQYQLFLEGRVEYGLTHFSRIEFAWSTTEHLYSRGIYLGLGFEF